MADQHEIKIPQNLLDDGHLRSIMSVLAFKELAQRHLDDAKSIGMDTTQLQNTFDESMRKLHQIRNRYFPGR